MPGLFCFVKINRIYYKFYFQEKHEKLDVKQRNHKITYYDIRFHPLSLPMIVAFMKEYQLCLKTTEK